MKVDLLSDGRETELMDRRPVTPSTTYLRWWRYHDTFTTDDLALLTESERNQAARFLFEKHSARFIRSRATVKRIIGGIAQLPAKDIHIGTGRCRGCGDSRHGPPCVRDFEDELRISISHSEGYSMLALSRRSAVGLDIERVRPMELEHLAASTLSITERRHVLRHPSGIPRSVAFLRCWTRKEAVLKAVGIGLYADLPRLDVQPDIGGEVRIRERFGGRYEDWAVQNLVSVDGLVIALARQFAGAGRVDVAPAYG